MGAGIPYPGEFPARAQWLEARMAVKRDFEGGVTLTPLHDFAPKHLHPDGIARRIRWEDQEGAGVSAMRRPAPCRGQLL